MWVSNWEWWELIREGKTVGMGDRCRREGGGGSLQDVVVHWVWVSCGYGTG